MTEIPSCKQEGATAIETEAQNSQAHLAGTETLPAKPVHRDVACELPREVSIDVGAHRTEGGPPTQEGPRWL